MTPSPSPEPDQQVFAGGMMISDPVQTRDEPAPLGFATPGLVVTGEGNDDAASAREETAGGWTQLIDQGE